jgi:DNA-binding PadR family transcriptional regulator
MKFKGNLEALILGALKDGPLHGYAIAKVIESQGSETLKVGENQLYPALHRLEEEGLVEAEWQPQENRPPRKCYRLTPPGEGRLAKYRREWAEHVSAISNLLGVKVGAPSA